MAKRKSNARVLLAAWFFALYAGGTAGCGGSAGSAAEVVEVRADSATIRIGGRTGVEVEFTVSTTQEVDTNPIDDEEPGYSTDPSDVAVIVPVGLRFIEGSSTLNDNFFGDNIFGDEDPRGPNRFVLCPDRSTALLYRFSRDELDSDNPLLKRIRFSVEGSSAEGQVTISAASAHTIANPCAIQAEDSTVVEVLP